VSRGGRRQRRHTRIRCCWTLSLRHRCCCSLVEVLRRPPGKVHGLERRFGGRRFSGRGGRIRGRRRERIFRTESLRRRLRGKRVEQKSQVSVTEFGVSGEGERDEGKKLPLEPMCHWVERMQVLIICQFHTMFICAGCSRTVQHLLLGGFSAGKKHYRTGHTTAVHPHPRTSAIHIHIVIVSHEGG
jgi:hypothetical protein